MKRVKGFGEQERLTEVVTGDLIEWYQLRSSENPDYRIIIENSQYVWD